MVIEKNISLDITNYDSFTTVKIKQYDNNVHRLNISLNTSDGSPFVIDADATAKLRMTKPDGCIVYKDCEITDNIVSVVLDDNITSSYGKARAEIGLYKQDCLLISSSFDINIIKSAINEDGIISSNDFSALTELMCKLNSILAYNVLERIENIEKEVFKENIALHCEISASAIEPDTGFTADKAVDGDSTSPDSRWSSGKTMKNNPVEPQWLQLDLKKDVTDITEIKIYFHAKVWATKYQIQTRASVDDEWKVVKDISNEASDEKNKIDIFTDIAELNRFVRFYFTELNPNADWGAVSVREIEIYQYTKGDSK